MRRQTLFTMQSCYREPFQIEALHFGAPEKSLCIVGNLRGNEVQQMYICSRLVRVLARLEQEGRIRKGRGVTVVPTGNPYSINIGKRFWAMDNSDINRMFPGYALGETTQRIAAGLFEKLQGYKYGVQFSSFYLAGDFAAHVRMMNTGYSDSGLAQLFGLPFVVLRKPVPFDTTTLNFNWQVWDTKAFSIYTRSTDTIDEKGAAMAVSAILRFMSRMGMLTYNIYGGYESTVLLEEELTVVRASSPGIYLPRVKPFDSVVRGQSLGEIIEPITGEVVDQVHAPDDGVVFFCKRDPLVIEHDTLFYLVSHLHR